MKAPILKRFSVTGIKTEGWCGGRQAIYLRQGATVKKNGGNDGKRALALVGPTASGKTGVALEVALRLENVVCR